MDCIKNILLLFILTVASCTEVYAWDKKASVGSPELDASAIFQVNTTEKGSIACPKMTLAERDLITFPAVGLCIFNTTTRTLETYSGLSWKFSSQMQSWETLTTYEVGSIVHESDKIYRSLNTHTSSVFAIDFANADWIELSDDLNRELNGTVVDNSIAIWDGTTGDNVQNSLVGISDGGEIISNVGGTQANADLNSSLVIEMSDATNAKLKYDSATASKFSIGEVGSEKEIATISDVQVLTNKEYGNSAAIDSNLILDMVSTVKASRPCNQMTEAQRDLLTAVIGSCIYNSDQKKLNIYDGTTWVSAGGGLDPWATSFDYKINDTVHENNKIYKSLTVHSSTVFATDLANGDWVEMSDDLNREIDGTVVDNAVTRWDGTTGDNVENSLVIIDDLGNMTGINDLTIGGSLIGSGGFSGDILDLAQVATPINPTVGRDKLYFKSDDKLYKLDSAGLEQEVGSSVSFANDNRLLRSDTVGAASIQESGISIDDLNNMSGVNDVAANGIIKALTPDAVNFKEAGEKYKGEENYFLRGQSDYGLVADWSGSNLTQDTTLTNFITGENSVWKWTNIATIGNQLTSKIIDIPRGMRASDIGYQFRYKYNGDDSDLDVLVQCVDDSSYPVGDGEHKLIAYTATNGSAFATGEFNPAGCSRVKVIFKVAIANSGKILFFDSVKVTPFNPTIKKLMHMTDWISYTPVFTSFGSASGIDFKWRRVGSDILINGIFTSGTQVASEFRIGLPSGLTSASSIQNLMQAGFMGWNAARGSTFSVTAAQASKSYFVLAAHSEAGPYTIINTTGPMPGSGATYTLTARLPIEGWKSDADTLVRMTDPNAVDSMIRFHTANGHGTTAGTLIRRYSQYTTDNNVAFQSAVGQTIITNSIKCRDIAATGLECEALSDGEYTITISDIFTSTQSVGISLNTTQISTGIDSIATKDRLVSETIDGNQLGVFSWTGLLKKGDVVREHTSGAAGHGILSVSNFTISKAKVSPHISIPIDDEFQNEFSAVINNNGTASIASDDNSGWIVNPNRTSLGTVVLDISSLALSHPLAVTVTSTDYETAVLASSSTSITVGTRNTGATFVDIPFSIKASRQLSDVKLKTGVVTGKFAATRTCIIEDRKAAGLGGGANPFDAIGVRTLNTKSGDCEFLSITLGTEGIDGTGNRFSLEKGKYNILCSTPAHATDQHQAFFYNWTDSINAMIGTSEIARSGAASQTRSFMKDQLTLSTLKEFELREYTNNVSTAGRGVSAVGGGTFGNTTPYDVYSQCKIQKVR